MIPKYIKVLTIFLISLLLFSVTGAAIIEIPLPDIPDDLPLSPLTPEQTELIGKIHASGDITSLSVELKKNALHIEDAVHSKKNIKVHISVIESLDCYNGKTVMIRHKNDNGIIDSNNIISVESDENGWVHFKNLEFSEIIIDAFVGTYEVTQNEIQISDSLNLGQSFDSDNISSLVVDIETNTTDPYSKVPTDGLVGWWKLDDDCQDSSGNGNHGTAHGDTHFVNGKYNNGSLFDGGCITVGESPSIDTGGRITISTWSYSNLVKSYYIVAKRDGNEKQYGLYIDPGGCVNFYTWGADSCMSSSVTVPVNRWVHTVVVFDSLTGAGELYLDGVPVATDKTASAISIATCDFFIGARGDGQGGNGYGIDGSVDNVLVYNRTLSETEIQTLYYDQLQQLQAKTNSNGTWSTEWNSAANNPLPIPYGSGEIINQLAFTVPETVVQNGITIYDYPKTAMFNATVIVGYTEDATKVQETASAGVYKLDITHAAANTTTGHINYITTNTQLTNADFRNSATLSTDNPNATLTTGCPDFSISTGYITAATEYFYNITVDYFYPPSNFNSINGTDNISLSWNAVPNADYYNLYIDDVLQSSDIALNYTHYSVCENIYKFDVSAINGTHKTTNSTVYGNVTLPDWTYYNVTGYVTSDGVVVTGATITNNQTSDIVTTDSAGYYSASIHNGTVLISCAATGYESNTIVVVVSGSDLSNQDIELTSTVTTVDTNLLPRMPYQIYIMLIFINMFALYYTFTITDTSYYTDVISSLLAGMVSFIIAHNSIIGILLPQPLSTSVQYDVYSSVALGFMFGAIGAAMLLFTIVKILELTHRELDEL